ncbi:hypothetical protein BLSTO_01437 [Blastocystis sp. subtype 1]
MESEFPNLVILKNKSLRALMTVMRDKNTPTSTFRVLANRVHTILVEEGVCEMPGKDIDVETPCGIFKGVEYPTNMCAVSILRSGDSLLQAFTDLYPEVPVGKVLIQRDEKSEDKHARLFYSKLPKDISQKYVFICDPMLATGGSVCEAIRLLKEASVPEDHIIFLNVVSAPEGIRKVFELYPSIKIVTCALDVTLNKEKYIVPVGTYGARDA